MILTFPLSKIPNANSFEHCEMFKRRDKTSPLGSLNAIQNSHHQKVMEVEQTRTLLYLYTKHRELWMYRYPNYKQSVNNKTCWVGPRSIASHIWNWLHPTTSIYTWIWCLEGVSKLLFLLSLFLLIDLYLTYIFSWRVHWRYRGLGFNPHWNCII